MYVCVRACVRACGRACVRARAPQRWRGGAGARQTGVRREGGMVGGEGGAYEARHSRSEGSRGSGMYSLYLSVLYFIADIVLFYNWIST